MATAVFDRLSLSMCIESFIQDIHGVELNLYSNREGHREKESEGEREREREREFFRQKDK